MKRDSYSCVCKDQTKNTQCIQHEEELNIFGLK